MLANLKALRNRREAVENFPKLFCKKTHRPLKKLIKVVGGKKIKRSIKRCAILVSLNNVSTNAVFPFFNYYRQEIRGEKKRVGADRRNKADFNRISAFCSKRSAGQGLDFRVCQAAWCQAKASFLVTYNLPLEPRSLPFPVLFIRMSFDGQSTQSRS